MRTAILCLTLAPSLALAQQPADVGGFLKFREQADASALAEKYAASIIDHPACDRYRDQLAKLAGGSLYDGRTVPQMTGILSQARAAGCHQASPKKPENPVATP